ncbi:MAG: hypothetical protein M1539_04235 [Actinobacteria bacterium]|nr:hypothetical protein [Actinomycetota bacterium]MCL5883167.1 hypothetical protein [Actinomycetota bacterium]
MKRLGILAVLAVLILAAGCGSVEAGGESSNELISPGLPAIELVAPAVTGAGEVPAFEWKPVDGAVSYRLVILDGGGNVLWAWTGPDTKVNLGGLQFERPEGVGGPVLTSGSSWSVVAFDANGNPVATSNIRSVSP